MSGSLLQKRTLCVVTGASRGLGRCITQKLAEKLVPSSLLLLMARNKTDLENVKTDLERINPSISVVNHVFDQSNLQECASKDLFIGILKGANKSSEDFEHALIIHNAGTAGDLTKYASEMTDLTVVENAMNINVTGTVLLNAVFMQTFQKLKRTIINISSLAALQPFPSWSLYCAGKAARDIFFETLSKEDPDVRVLNYAPGPLDTDMQTQCRQCKDPELRKVFTEMKETGKLLSCEQSVTKMIKLLEVNSFISGKHIDYNDI